MVATVSFPDVAESTKLAWHEMLSTYFDGDTHEVGGQSIEFPEAQLFFHQQELKNDGAPSIVLILGKVGETIELNCLVDGVRGKELRTKIGGDIFVRCSPDMAQDETRSLKGLENIWAKLFALLKTKTADFSARNIHAIVVDPIPDYINHEPGIIAVAGSVDMEIRCKYKHSDPA